MAGRIALDLKKFKHVKTGKDTTTLRHADGHELQISHKNLSPEFKTQLSALAGIPKLAEDREDARQMKQTKMADGGDVPRQRYYDGETKVAVPPKSTTVRTNDPTEKPVGPVQQSLSQMGQNIKNAYNEVIHPSQQKMASGGSVQSGSPTMNMAKGGRAMYADGTTDPFGVQQIIPQQNQAMSENAQPYEQTLNESQEPDKDLAEHIAHLTAKYGVEPLAKALHQAKFTAEQAANTLGSLKSGFEKSPTVRSVESQIAGNDELPVQQPQAAAPSHANQPSDSNVPAQAQDISPPTPPPPQAETPPASPQPKAQPLAPGQQPPATMHATIQDSIRNAEQGANQAVDAANASGVAAGDIAQEKAKVSQLGAGDLLKLQQDFQNDFKSLNQERLAHIQDIQNGQIDPEKYWNNHSKISAGIGMLIAGFNPTTNPNAAMNYLQHQMDNNLEAQKQNLASKYNILKSTMDQFGNARDATEMAKIYQQDALAQQLLAAAPKAQNDQARLMIQQKAGELQQQSAAQLYQMAKDRQYFNLINQTPGTKGTGKGSKAPIQNEDYAKDPEGTEARWMERQNSLNYYNPTQAALEASRHIPGVADATTPVDAKDRDVMTKHKTLDTMLKNYRDYSNKYKNNWSNLDIPERLKIQNKGAAMGKELQAVLGDTLDMGVSEQSKKDLESMLPSNPTKFLPSIAVEPRVSGFIEQNRTRLNGLKNKYRLPPEPAEQPQTQSQEPQYKTVNGIKYMRGPNGEPIPVK